MPSGAAEAAPSTPLLGIAEACDPTPVDDLAARLKVLRENSVRRYRDGKLEIDFETRQRPSFTLAEMALADRAAADAR